MLSQITAITGLNLKSIPERWASSLVIVVGLAGVVAVFTALLAMATGFEKTLAATGSYLSARHGGGRWLLRIDDLDRDRCLPGLADDFQATLRHFGFEWDGNVCFQSHRTELYRSALAAIVAIDTRVSYFYQHLPSGGLGNRARGGP